VGGGVSAVSENPLAAPIIEAAEKALESMGADQDQIDEMNRLLTAAFKEQDDEA